jgi:hypothetical protein
MTNWYGGYIAAPTGTGTITNKYALVTEANAGNVGIGTTSPTAKLSIANTTTAAPALSIDRTNTTGSYTTIRMSTAGVPKWYIGMDSDFFPSADTFSINNGTAAQGISILQSNGNVGIGTTGPTATLTVAGGIFVPRNYTYAGLWFAGTDDAVYDTNHVLWNDYRGGPTTRGGAGSGWDGMKWNLYNGIQFRTGVAGATDRLIIDGPNNRVTFPNGNVGIGTAATSPTHLIELDSDTYGTTTGWTDISDRNKKENFTSLTEVSLSPVKQGVWTRSGAETIEAIEYNQGTKLALSDKELLNRLSLLPIWRYNFINDEEQNKVNPGASIFHLGPTAQDFYKLFNLGASDTNLRATDLAGVALAGIKALDNELATVSASLANLPPDISSRLKTQTVRLSQVEEDISGMVLELAQVKSDVAALQDEMASVSSRLAKVEQLAVSGEQLAQLTANPYLLTAFDIATISGDLKVLGQTDLAKTVIGGELTVGLLHFDDLKASISSLTGQVLIDGDLRVAGDATVSGQLRVEKGLVIPDSVTGENYCVRVASGAAVVVKGECQ